MSKYSKIPESYLYHAMLLVTTELFLNNTMNLDLEKLL